VVLGIYRREWKRQQHNGDLTYALVSSPANGYDKGEDVATSMGKGWIVTCNDNLKALPHVNNKTLSCTDCCYHKYLYNPLQFSQLAFLLLSLLTWPLTAVRKIPPGMHDQWSLAHQDACSNSFVMHTPQAYAIS